MNLRQGVFAKTIALSVFSGFLIGCEVETQDQPPLSYPPANHLVINEVFTLPGSDPNAHSWIEIYNPTQQVVNLFRWSLSFKTSRSRVAISIYYDSSGLPLQNRFEIRLFQDAVGTYDAPIVAGDSVRVRYVGSPVVIATVPPPIINRRFELGPGEFLTLVSDIERLRVYNTIGPGNGPSPDSSPELPLIGNAQGGFFISELAMVQRDSANLQLELPDTAYGYSYSFFLDASDQIVLKDSAGRAVDVVRYGNYTYNGPGADPYPNNRSAGVVPPFESLARYAGAYDTDNSAEDFYVTRAALRPIPHWISQLYKK